MPDETFSMAEYQEEFEGIPEEGFATGPEIEDGTHQAVISQSRMVAKEDRRWWLLEFTGTSTQGMINRWFDLDNEIDRSMMKKTAIALGYRGESFDAIVDEVLAGRFDDLEVEIFVKTKAGDKRDFKNVYVNKAYGTKQDVAAAPAADEDIPF